MLVVALLLGTVGYTLLYAGIRNPTVSGHRTALEPWLLWVQAFRQLNTEAAQIVTLPLVPGGPAINPATLPAA